MRTSRLAVVVCVAALLVACADDPSPEAASTTTTTEAPVTTTEVEVEVDRGPFAVGVRTETYVDETRETKASGGAPALPTRTLETMLLYPAAGAAGGEPGPDAPAASAPPGGFPLVVFAHGFTAKGPDYTGALTALVEAGYVVAAPTFPLSSGGRATPPDLTDYVEQPDDVRFVLQSVLAAEGDLVDADRVAVGGHSLGAMTTLGFGFNTCCGDPGVDAYVAVAGVEAPFPDGEFDFAGRAAPLLLIHGDQDRTLAWTGSEALFEASAPPTFFLTLLGGPHTPWVEPYQPVIEEVTLDFLDHYLRDAGSLDALERGGEVAGVSRLERKDAA